MNTAQTYSGPLSRGRGSNPNAPSNTNSRGRPHSRNKHWTAGGGHSGADTERWERGGARGGVIVRGRGRDRGGGERGGRKFPNQTLRNTNLGTHKEQVVEVQEKSVEEVREDDMEDVADDDEGEEGEEEFGFPEIYEQDLETQEEREKFYQELVKAREVERKKAIAEGKMDDPLVPKRLEDAITMVGTCMDMCPRFERYRRERENNLFEWETIPGTKRVDHRRAVKMYERAAGDKTLPSDLRPPKVLKRTLDYLFHGLLPRGGFSQTYTFIRDRSRAVRNDFTMQHDSGPIAMECHDRCARFHILALHFERDKPGFSIALEEQQLMNTLQSLKEFYTEQRPHYASPTELEMRVYHRLVHIRDQRERHEDIPSHITSHSVFKLTTLFRHHVQAKSAPITKTSNLVVDEEGMRIFGELASVLRQEGSTVMIYLVACILERLFGKDTIEDIESIRGELRVQDIIDGKVDYSARVAGEGVEVDGEMDADLEMDADEGGGDEEEFLEEGEQLHDEPQLQQPSPFPPPPSAFFGQPAASAFAGPSSTGPTSVFGRTFGATTSASSVSQPTFFGIQPPKLEEKSKSPPLSFFGAAGGKDLADTRPLGGEISGLSTSPQQPVKPVFGDFGSSPFQAHASGAATAAPAPAQPTPGPFFSLNPGAQAFKPSTSSIFGAQTGPVTFGLTPPASNAPAAPAPALNTQPPPTAPVPTSQTPTPPLTHPRKSITPPSLRIDTQSVNPPQPSADGLPIIPIPIPPTPQDRPLARTQALGREPTEVMDATMESPVVPPALGRLMPVSLPGTPSGNGFAVPHPILGWIGANGESIPVTPPTGGTPVASGSGSRMLTSGVSGSGSFTLGALSPLDMPSFLGGSGFSSPRKGLGQGAKSGSGSLLTSALLRKDVKGVRTPAGEVLPSPIATSSTITATSATAAAPPIASTSVSTSQPSPKREPEEPVPTNAEIKLKARSYLQRKILSKYWSKWKKKYGDVIAWAEAVQSSDAYRVKMMKLKLRAGTDNLVARRAEKRRRGVSGAGVGVSEGEERGVIEEVERKEGVEGVVRSVSESPSRKRQRMRREKRISGVFVEPRTDEEIAKRFKENRAENQTLWAQGSYLVTIRAHVTSLTKSSQKYPYYHQQYHQQPWNIWLSLNPESDSSAIWLEKKFDVPKSGRWASENVFEIPVLEGRREEDGRELNGDEVTNGKGKGKEKAVMNGKALAQEERCCTGLIVFECTPLDGVKDDIEKKYCVLDDCSRLRDIIDALSPKRRYVPSLLILNWGSVDGDQSEVEPDAEFMSMVKKCMNESVLAGYATLGITTTANLDSVLSGVLQNMRLDVEGKLVKSLTIRGIFRTFEEYFSNFLIEWLDNCSANGYFDWTLYAHLVQATIGMLNKMGSLVSAMLSKSKRDLIPSFDVDAIRDSDTVYEAAFTWLSRINDQDDTEKIAVDLQSHVNIGQDFPTRTFIQHLLELTVLRTEKHASIKSSQETRLIPLIDLKAALELFEAAIQPFQTNLSLALNMSVRRSPKRRGMSEETDVDSPEAKRLKLAPSFASTGADTVSPPATPFMNGRNHSPSPSITSINTSTSIALTDPPAGESVSASVSLSGSPSQQQITVAMLRALTRDMKRKYGAGSASSSPAGGKGAAPVPSTPASYARR